MAEKKAIPSRIDWVREYTNNYGTFHVFEIQFDNGDVGEFTTTKKDDQTKFTIDEEVVYTATENTDKQGNVYNKIDKPKQDQRPSGSGGSRGQDPLKQRSIMANVALECANRIIIHMDQTDAIKPDLAGLKTMADKFYNYIMTKSAGDTQKSITIQAQLKIVTEYFHLYPNLEFSTSDQALQFVDEMVAYVYDKAKG